MSRLKQALDNHQVGYGLFVGLKDPAIVEIVGYAGYDFVIIDLEHSALDLSTMEHMIRAANLVGITAIVRVPQDDYATILRVLEAGAEGVMFPHLVTREQGEKIVQMAKYYPLGGRGLDPTTRVAKYGHVSMLEHMEEQNKRVQLIGMIEDKEALDQLDDILSVKGLDLLFIGTSDLSASLGLPGQVKHPEVQEAIRIILDKAAEQGVPVGMPAYDLAIAQEWIQLGAKFICTPPVDTFHLSKTFREHLLKLKEFVNMPAE